MEALLSEIYQVISVKCTKTRINIEIGRGCLTTLTLRLPKARVNQGLAHKIVDGEEIEIASRNYPLCLMHQDQVRYINYHGKTIYPI